MDTMCLPLLRFGSSLCGRFNPVVLPKRLPEFDMREPARGRVVGTLIHEHGSGYYRPPSISLDDPTGTGVRLVAIPGDDGRRIIGGDQLAFETDLSTWRLFGDGDQRRWPCDLLLHDPVSGNVLLINLGPDAAFWPRNSQLQQRRYPASNPAGRSVASARWVSTDRDVASCCNTSDWPECSVGRGFRPSDASPRWITDGSSFLPTVADLGWSMTCTNNAARNMGDRVYWIDPDEGSMAQWKIEIDSDLSSDEWLKAPDYLRDSNGDRIVGMKSSWEVVGAGSLAGHPRSDGSNAFRDLLLFDRKSGRSAIWLMDMSGSQIDGSAPNGGGRIHHQRRTCDFR